MGILTNFLKQEESRIERLFELVERFAPAEVDQVLTDVFEVYAIKGFLGRAVLDALKVKIAKACAIPNHLKEPDSEFIAAFSLLDDSKKRCLLVTIANDCCKLGVLNESQVITFLQSQLAKTPAASNALKSPGKLKGRL